MNKPHPSELSPAALVGNPLVKLFAFQLRDAVGLPTQTQPSTLHPQAEALWQQCIALGQTLDIPALKELKSLLRCYQGNVFTPNLEDQDATLSEQPYLINHLDLLNVPQKGDQYARTLCFHTTQNGQGPTLYGELYPQRIHDTYALDLTLRLRDIVPLTQLTAFAPLHTLCPSLGHTLVLVVEPVNTPPESELAFADACAAQFMQQPQSHCQPTAQGQFFGNPLFEYTPPDPHQPDRPLHLWVWLNRNPAALGRIDQPEPYHALINLLCALHKSRFAFAQATDGYQQAQAIAHQLETKVNQLSHAAPLDTNSLEQWKDWIQSTPATAFNYARLIRDIEDHRITLDANTTNFSSSLAKLQKHGQADDDLSFLEQWLTTITQHQRQIDVWQRYLATSQPLFQQLIDTIRGLVDIAAQKQAQAKERREKKRDRTLQAAIAAVGTGLAVSGITSQFAPSAIVAMPAEPQPSSWLYWRAFVINTGFHIFLGFCFALVAYKIWLPKSNTRSRKR
jgi:hypothetical protein